MKNPSSITRKIAYWTLPPFIYNIFRNQYNRLQAHRMSPELKTLLKRNHIFYNKHVGQRCFILATGPSISSQDITPLRDEYSFAVSDLYRHPDYQIIKPAYHHIAPIHPPFTEEVVIKRYNELAVQQHENQAFFFGLRDKTLVERSKFSKNADNVFFLSNLRQDQEPEDIDLTQNIPSVTSAAIMAILVSIFMGFSDIYLLGCDHNNIWMWDGNSADHKLEHFYQGAPSIGYEPFNIDHAMAAHLNVRKQYKWVKRLAENKNTRIYNASPSSFIDIFPKVRFESIL